jgi:hypothetical protein
MSRTSELLMSHVFTKDKNEMRNLVLERQENGKIISPHELFYFFGDSFYRTLEEDMNFPKCPHERSAVVRKEKLYKKRLSNVLGIKVK